MQHEVLVCLLGHCGDVVVDTGKGAFAVAADIPFLAPSDKALINRIVKVGYDYSCIHAFAQRVTRFDARVRSANFGGVVFLATATAADGGNGDAKRGASSQNPSSTDFDAEGDGRGHGVYMRTLGAALGATLDEYRGVVMAEERAYMADSTRPLSQLLCSLRKYELLFPALRATIAEVRACVCVCVCVRLHMRPSVILSVCSSDCLSICV
jgi:hypothetical protein